MPTIRLGPSPVPPLKKPRTPPPAPNKTLFEQLLPVSWRGINFPISSMKLSLSQDLVEHKYWGVDGARVEATGRAPMQIEASIPFVNGIVPGKGETWGVLYPTTFRDFLKAFADRTTGILNHPELGEIVCKPHSIDFSHEAQHRDGVFVTAKWVETTSDDVDTFQVDSPVAEAVDVALTLDASKDDLLKLVPDGAFPEETFDSLINKLSGFVDQIGITATLLINKPNQIIHRVQTLQNSVERTRNALTWPVIDACERMKEAMHKVESHTVVGTGPQAGLGTPSRKVARFTLQGQSTVSLLGSLLPFPNTADELIALNPSLLARPDILNSTVIRYYAS